MQFMHTKWRNKQTQYPNRYKGIPRKFKLRKLIHFRDQKGLNGSFLF